MEMSGTDLLQIPCNLVWRDTLVGHSLDLTWLYSVHGDVGSNNNNNNNHIQRCSLRFFNNLLAAPRTVSSSYTQVARVQSCANHVQHIERLSHATCRVACHVVQRDSSAIKFDRV